MNKNDPKFRAGFRLVVVKDYDELSQAAAEIIIRQIQERPEALLCAGSGSTPQGAYARVVEHFRMRPKETARLRVIKLDEWMGLRMDDPATTERYLQERLLRPLRITARRYISFDSRPRDAQAECDRVERALRRSGPIDLGLLGLGKNGHLGLNEPAKAMVPRAHISRLTAQTAGNDVFRNARPPVTHGLTLGMADLLAARHIVFVVNGRAKKAVLARVLRGEVTPQCPASFLWLHSNVTCIADEEALDGE